MQAMPPEDTLADPSHDSVLVPPLYEATVSEWIRFHMMRGPLQLSEAGLERPVRQHADMHELHEAVRAKHSPSFSEARDARYRMGHLRYGLQGWGDTHAYVESAVKRLQAYLAEGNREHLVDAANLIELVWIHPDREGTYFESVDGGDSAHAASLRAGCL